MAHFFRLITALLVAAFFTVASPAAHALAPEQQCQIDGVAAAYGGDRFHDSCSAASSLAAGMFAVQPTTANCNLSYPTSTPCLFTNSGGTFSRTVTYRASCTSNSSAKGETCACDAGYIESNNKCVLEEKKSSLLEEFCKQGSTLGKGVNLVGSAAGSTPVDVCYMPGAQYGLKETEGCAMKLGDTVAVPNSDGSRSWSGAGAYTGKTCTQGTGTGTGGGGGEGGTGTGTGAGDGTSTAGPRAAENPCPKGFPGTINGASVCVPAVSNSGVDSTSSSTTTNSDGSKSEVKEDVKCTAGTCVTTTTTNYYSNNGSPLGTTTTRAEESIGAKCAKQPASKLCTEVGLNGNASSGNGSGSGSSGSGASSFAGNCLSGFKAVSDDAVTNAMAEEQYRRNCEVLRTDTEQAKAVEAASDKEGTSKASNPNDSSVTVGPSNFDQTDLLGGGGCSLDKTITVAKTQFTLPFNAICNPLASLGQLLVAVSFLAALVIVTRG